MAHQIYDNFYLSNEIEDQFNSHLDLQPVSYTHLDVYKRQKQTS